MKEGRLVSLDAFRGFDMMMIIGVDAIMRAFDVWLNGSAGFLSAQFSHPKWLGLSFYDTIFPTFLFIAGASFPFSYAKQVERGLSSRRIHLRILTRCITLILLGFVVNGFFNFDFANFRYCSVLGKIGMAWAIAAVLYIHFGCRTRLAICAGLLALYAVLLNTVVAPDFPDASPMSLEGNFIGWLDRHFMPGRLYQSNLMDPSSVFCNIFATGTALLGVFAGEIVRSPRFEPGRKALNLALFAAVLLSAGLLAIFATPLSKRLWTPSFTLCVGGYSAAMFALFYWICDVRRWRGWATFLVVIGMNSITIYMLQCFVNFNSIATFFLRGTTSRLSPAAGALLVAVGGFAVRWLVLYFLYRKKTFLKV